MAEARIALQSSGTVPGNWNVSTGVPTPGAWFADLVDFDTGASLGWSAEIVSGFQGNLSTVTNGPNITGSGDAAWVGQAVIAQHAVQVGGVGTNFRFRLSGLTGSEYTVEVFPSTTNAGSRHVRLSFLPGDDPSSEVNGANSQSTAVCRITGLVPSNGELEIRIGLGPTATSASLANAVRIIETAGGGGGGPISLSGTIAGSSGMSGHLSMRMALAGRIEGQSQVSGQLGMRLALSGRIDGQSSMQGDLTGIIPPAEGHISVDEISFETDLHVEEIGFLSR